MSSVSTRERPHASLGTSIQLLIKHILPPGPEPGTEFRFELPAKFGVGRSKLGVPGHIYPEIKRSMVKFTFFLTSEVEKFTFF